MNNILENIRIAFTGLISNKLRAVLTIFGVGIGIGAVIILVSLGNAAQAYINNQILSTGANLIQVSNGGSFFGRGETAGVKLGMRDVATLQTIPGIRNVVPSLNTRLTTTFEVSTTNTAVSGTTPAYFDVQNRSAAAGRLFDDNDIASNARVVVLGQTTVQTLFPDGRDPIGQNVMLGAVSFKVIGTLIPLGTSGLGQDQDDIILVPLSTAQAKLSTARNVFGDLPVSSISLEVSNTDLVPDLMTTVTDALRTAHKLKPTDQNDFNVSSAQDTLASLNSLITTFTLFLAVIGGISLLVGGIGVMNIMLVTVTERTREIGLRKAVGAKFFDILWQFLTEAVVLCFVGGVAGLVLAFAAIALLNALVAGLNPTVSAGSVILAVGVVTLVGVFFGAYPASRAASLSPIAALRTD